jgi:hypothetical protein
LDYPRFVTSRGLDRDLLNARTMVRVQGKKGI